MRPIFTCSIIKAEGDGSGDRIYAAQNITERRRAEKRIRYLARIDALTKIPNRMQFQHLLQQSIAKARRARKPLCLFYIDIDNFKAYNDSFGHLVGDEVLRTVAQTVRTRMRPNDMSARFGGDELAILLPECDLADAETLAERLRRTVAEATVPTLEASVPPSPTVSIGLLPSVLMVPSFKELYSFLRSSTNA